VRVVFTPRARRRAAVVDAWWRKHREAAPDLFADELLEAAQILASRPHAGFAYASIGGSGIRRLLLPRTEQHVYYSIRDAESTVIVHTVWGARRGRGPRL